MKSIAIMLCLLLVDFVGVFGAEKKKPCFQPLSKCLSRGCAKQDTPNAIANIVKRNFEPEGDMTTLTFKDFASLQAQVEKKFDGEYSTLTEPDRMRLRNLKVGGEELGEGDLVEIIGFIAVETSKSKKSKPHANSSGESVNCRITGQANNDFHISITPNRNGSEFGGIVVEMIPQERDENWTLARLNKAQEEDRMVRIQGQLFFDNHHLVNDDPAHNLGNQPKRMSLWEIHPVTGFEICIESNCEPGDSGWKPLEDWEEDGD